MKSQEQYGIVFMYAFLDLTWLQERPHTHTQLHTRQPNCIDSFGLHHSQGINKSTNGTVAHLAEELSYIAKS